MRVNVVNPLIKDGNIRKIIECYFKSRTQEQFNTSIKNYVSFRNYSEKSSETFAAKEFAKVLFEYWKNQILNIKLDKFPYKKYNMSESDLLYLKSTIIDKNNLFDEYSINNSHNKRLYEIFNKMNYLYEQNEYRNINSYMFYIDQRFQIEDEFIVSINIKSRALVFKLLTKYISICLNNKFPFNIKFSDTLNNDNTVIIYSNKNNLEKIINILTSIRRENPELDAELNDVVKTPPILYGVVDDWIGIRQKDDNFYDNRINCLYEAIHSTICKWYDDDFKYKESQYSGMTYKDVIDSEITNYFNHELNYLCLGKLTEFFAKNKIEKLINEILNAKYEDLKEYRISVKKDKDIVLTLDDINNRIYELMGTIYRNNKEFLDDVRNNIVLYCNKYNIDSKRFYLDTKSSSILYAVYDELYQLESDLSDYLLIEENPKEKVLNKNYKL